MSKKGPALSTIFARERTGLEHPSKMQRDFATDVAEPSGSTGRGSMAGYGPSVTETGQITVA